MNDKTEQLQWNHNLSFCLDPIATREVTENYHLAEMGDKILNQASGDAYTDVLVMFLRYRNKIYIPDEIMDYSQKREESTNKVPKFNNPRELPRRVLTIVEWIYNLQNLGYTVRFKDAFETIGFMSDKSFKGSKFNYVNEYLEYVYNILSIASGENRKFVPMIHDFNLAVRDDDTQLYVNAILHYAYGVDENGEDIDFYNRSGDLKLADGEEAMTEEDIKKIMSDECLEGFEILTFTTNVHELNEVIINMMQSNTTWSDTMKTDFIRYIKSIYRGMTNRFGDWLFKYYDKFRIANKENLAFVANTLLKEGLSPSIIMPSINNGKDVLRIYAGYSGSDASLTNPPHFKNKLNGSERKFFMDLLMEIPHLYEDASRDPELWKRAFERIHPERYGHEYDKVKTVAEKIRKGDYAKTANSLIEEVVQRGSTDLDKFKEGLKFFEKFPSQFIRYFDSYVRHYGTKLGEDLSENSQFQYLVSSELHYIIKDVESTKMLFQLLAYYYRKLVVRDEFGSYSRYVQLKGARKYTALPVVTDNLCNPKYLTDFYQEIYSVIYMELITRFHSLPWLGNVYIDPVASGCTVPVNLRNANSTGLSILAEGSVFSCNPGQQAEDQVMDIIYMPYIHWTNPKRGSIVDLDLSVSFYDENFGRISHCSFRNLVCRGKDNVSYAMHSGDITDGGPYDGDGAFEACIISRNGAVAAGAAYALIDIHSYTMQKFSEINCYFGFQAVPSYITKTDAHNRHLSVPFKVNPGTETMSLGDLTNKEFPKKIDPSQTMFTSYVGCESRSVAMVLIDLNQSLAMWLDRDLFGTHIPPSSKITEDAYKVWESLFAASPSGTEKWLKESGADVKNYVSNIGGNTIDRTQIDEITQFKAALEKPKLFCSDLLNMHANARGVVVQDPKMANLIFTLPGTPVAARAREDQQILTPFMVDRWINEFLMVKDKD